MGLTTRFPIKGYPDIYYIANKRVYKFEGRNNKRTKDAFVQFVKKSGWQQSRELGLMDSPFGIVGTYMRMHTRIHTHIYL